DPLPQLVAESIATFQYNNCKRSDLKLPPLAHVQMIIPGIVMQGSAPTFYLTPITTELSNAVIRGCTPAFQTIVKEYYRPK
ncbi:hypothetical protein JB92DRAFT_2707061, partial [Gautieria morchelliformis]